MRKIVNETKNMLKEIDFNNINKNLLRKTTIMSFVITILCYLPIATLFLGFFLQITSIFFLFYILIGLVLILLMLFFPIFNLIYYTLLKNYCLDNEEIQNLNVKKVFLADLFSFYNIGMTAFCIIVAIVIIYFI